MPASSVSAPATATIDLIRARLGDRYALERELGRGGMGTVYLARDLRLDRPVALKVLPPEFATQTALRERFLLETRTAAKFSHPNIVPVYAVEESEDLSRIRWDWSAPKHAYMGISDAADGRPDDLGSVSAPGPCFGSPDCLPYTGRLTQPQDGGNVPWFITRSSCLSFFFLFFPVKVVSSE